MRDKIAKIIREAYLSDPTWDELEHAISEHTDQILALFPSRIVVEEECPECWGSNDCVDANYALMEKAFEEERQMELDAIDRENRT